MGNLHHKRKGGFIKKVVLIFILSLIIANLANARVRHIVVENDQISKVNTALGIATIIQVPDRPNSVIVGDQESFKVEYLDQAITIKPLHSGAKSNLYIYTDWKRYNVQLVTGSELSADYIVYLDNPMTKKETIKKSFWDHFSARFKNDELTFATTRIGKLRDNLFAIEFAVSSNKRIKFDPSCLWLTQKGVSKPIHNLFLSELELNPDSKISGVMQILITDLDPNEPLRIEMKRKKQSFLTLPKVHLWGQQKRSL